MTIDTRSMTTDDLRAIQSQVCKELEKRAEEEKENAWKDVVATISYYVTHFGDIEVYDCEYILRISGGHANMSENGSIEITY